MRWLRKHRDKERGGVSILVALLMVVLLGFAAIAVDVGMLYSEKAQLQNGADAAALLVAQKCAKNQADAACATTSTLATSIVNGNALDGRSNVKSLALDLTNRTVKVTAGAQELGQEANRVSLFFANALGMSNTEVNASASVQWGSPIAGRTALPLTFSICQVRDHVDGAQQLLVNHGSNANPDCMYGPSGASVEGGFGWLTQDPGVCGGTIDLAVSEGGSDPGNSAPGNCATTLQKWADEINAGREIVVLLPVYDAVTGTGNGAIYHMISFAAFKVTGWKFTGDGGTPYTFRNESPYVTSSTLECKGNCRGIIGRFIKYVSLSDGYTLGPVDSNGATIVRFSQ
jgi:Flp pilus assembly protein TadG